MVRDGDVKAVKGRVQLHSAVGTPGTGIAVGQKSTVSISCHHSSSYLSIFI